MAQYGRERLAEKESGPDGLLPDRFAEWVGRQETATDWVTPSVLSRFAATFDRQGGTAGVNPLVHWLFFLPDAPQAALAADGHPRKGEFIPPVALPRRMWAGSSLRFSAPLVADERISRVSTIRKVEQKTGRSGELVFVAVDHRISGTAGLAVAETQDIVYRDSPAPAAGSASGQQRSGPTARSTLPEKVYDWTRTVEPDTALLLRYSALTFNAHKIHYDRGYTTRVEGYPGLVVHGPLVATLLLDLFLRQNPGSPVVGFDFRAVAPLYDTAPFTTKGAAAPDGASLWAEDADGIVCMTARVFSTADGAVAASGKVL